MTKVRAKQSVTQDKLLGKDVLCFLNFGETASYEAPKWALLGGQRSCTYTANAEEIDTATKDDGGYGDSEPGVMSTEISLEIICKPKDEAVAALLEAFEAREAADVMRWAKSGRSIRNWFSILSYEETAAKDDAVIISLKLKGKGKPTFKDNEADPRL